MQNFQADLFVIVSSSSKANLVGRRTEYDFLETPIFGWVENLFWLSRDRIPTGRGSQIGGLGGQERAKEGHIDS